MINRLVARARAFVASLVIPFLDADVWIRAAKTLWQTALGTLIATAPALADVHSWNAWKSLLAGAVAAGLSAAWNTHLRPLVDAARARISSAVATAKTHLGIGA